MYFKSFVFLTLFVGAFFMSGCKIQESELSDNNLRFYNKCYPDNGSDYFLAYRVQDGNGFKVLSNGTFTAYHIHTDERELYAVVPHGTGDAVEQDNVISALDRWDNNNPVDKTYEIFLYDTDNDELTPISECPDSEH